MDACPEADRGLWSVDVREAEQLNALFLVAARLIARHPIRSAEASEPTFLRHGLKGESGGAAPSFQIQISPREIYIVCNISKIYFGAPRHDLMPMPSDDPEWSVKGRNAHIRNR